MRASASRRSRWGRRALVAVCVAWVARWTATRIDARGAGTTPRMLTVGDDEIATRGARFARYAAASADERAAMEGGEVVSSTEVGGGRMNEAGVDAEATREGDAGVVGTPNARGTVIRPPPGPVAIEPEVESVVITDAREMEDFELLDPPVSADTNHEHATAESARPGWMKTMWKARVDALSDEERNELNTKMETVPEELKAIGIEAGDELFVTFGTASVQDFVFNWVAAAKKLNLKPIFVGALDEEMHELCKRAGVPSMLLTGRSVLLDRDAKFITGRSKAFKKMGTVKTKFVQDLLDLGIAPILSDADVVWMRDPREVFNNGTFKYADILISSDCIDTVGDRKDDKSCLHVNFNTGVLYIRPTTRAKEFVEKWKHKVATSEIAWMRDQPALNLLVRDGHPPLEVAVRVPADKRGLPGYRSLLFAANNTIRLGVLPVAQFSNGHTFFVQEHHVHHPEDGEPYSVHMTYQYGDTHDYAYGKRQRLRQHGLWYLDDDGDHWSDGKYLTISTSGSWKKFEGKSTIGVDAEAYATAISRHFEEDSVRRVTVRNGLALAKALNRTLVLPPARCYCDKIWNTLAGCRALGAETAHLPFSCPMDHIYNLEGFLKLGIEFREAGFLEDERLSKIIREDVVHVKVGEDAHENSADVVIPRGFTTNDALKALKPVSKHAVIMFDKLDDGSLCGFGSDQEDRDFDEAVEHALIHDQYFCFREAHIKQGKPRSGSGNDGKPWEPRVVERHCGVAEGEQRGKANRGVVSEIMKDPIECSCEWGYKKPTRLSQTECKI
ncbi:nucleotide-diphospho-sugar transferase-domain-containing protein [Ostreococcus tauri]|uniref:Nucleotide-diphospho-sugar transferase-domain-containing protein n=1 Tax=Ostreococcus tauri TaxID=70448 RepID=A0A1Y5IAU9_OSTTA|nr:nucleotide-diphospho-sugar transferase-domain-containing protein [Ostreococcus tauri]